MFWRGERSGNHVPVGVSGNAVDLSSARGI
jgi:hypothetical protein